jgi:hypothetical protein
MTQPETTIRELLILVVACSALTGCVTQAQQEAERIGKITRDAYAQYTACRTPLDTNPRYARVYEKLGVATASQPNRAPSAVQLADSQIISDDDIALGLEWYAEGQACATPAIEALGRIDPEFQIFFADTQAEIADIINDLVSTRQTYGQVNARLLSLKARQRVAAGEMGNNLKARLQAQHQEEVAQQQEVAEQLVSAIGNIALALATRGRASIARLASRQSVLGRAQIHYASMHPRYVVVHRVRTTHCESIGRSLRCGLR